MLLAAAEVRVRRESRSGGSSELSGDDRVLRAEVVAGIAVALVWFDLAMLVDGEDVLESLLVFGC